MTREELQQRQWASLQAGLDRALRSNSFYRHKLEAARVDPADLRSLADLGRLPLTTKQELLDDQERSPPYGTNLSRPVGVYTRLHQTSGTSTGRRLRWLDSPGGWEWVLDCWTVIYEAAGVRPDDRFFFPFSFGPFLGFWAAWEGAARLGRFVLAGGGLTTRARLDLLLENRITFVLCTPTYALRMAEVALQDGLDLAASPVRCLILAGEPGASIPATRRRLETVWGARVLDHYGMTEIGSLGVEFESLPGRLFVLEDQAIAEFLRPGTTEPVPEREVGELVLTNLGRWDSPLIRYRTGDLVRWRRDVFPAGRPLVHLEGGILGRTDDMLWIKGNNVYPSAIENIVREFAEVGEFAVAIHGSGPTAELEIQIEPLPGRPGEAALLDAVSRAVQDRLYFRPRVTFVEPGSLPRFEMKSQRFRPPSNPA